MSRRSDLAPSVEAAMTAHPHVVSVQLVGSRASGTATVLSDWDFSVEVDDFPSVESALPSLVSELEPLAQQWDRLGPEDYRCYMLMLPGPAKVDLIFPGIAHRPAPPWDVVADSLPGIDAHFWDWALWMASKRLAGKGRLVAEQLASMSRHLLQPMGVPEMPDSIEEAVTAYLAARDRLETRFEVRVPRRLEREVRPVIVRA